MLGAIAGDIIGSPYEFDHNNIKTTDFPLFSERSRFTDDSILTVATAEVILTHGDYAEVYKKYHDLYPDAGWGSMFSQMARAGALRPYGSFGNGAAMRVSPVGFAFGTLEETLQEAERSAAVTHDHPEGVKGAQATAAAIFLARTGSSKEAIRRYITDTFGYDLSRTLGEIRPGYHHVESCQETVPEAITAFLEADGFEDAIRKAVSLGGDSDTLACITGGIAEAFYGGIPEHIRSGATLRLDDSLLRMTGYFRRRRDRIRGLRYEELDLDELDETALDAAWHQAFEPRVITRLRGQKWANGSGEPGGAAVTAADAADRIVSTVGRLKITPDNRSSDAAPWQSGVYALADCIFSAQARYLRVVKPMLDRWASVRPNLADRADLAFSEFMGDVDSFGPNKFDEYAGRVMTRHVLAGRRKVEVCYDAAGFFARRGLETADDIRACGTMRDLILGDLQREVRGIGPALARYLLMLLGDEEQIKPDTMVLRFWARSGLSSTNPETMLAAFQEAARRLGTTAARLDHAVWQHESSQ